MPSLLSHPSGSHHLEYGSVFLGSTNDGRFMRKECSCFHVNRNGTEPEMAIWFETKATSIVIAVW